MKDTPAGMNTEMEHAICTLLGATESVMWRTDVTLRVVCSVGGPAKWADAEGGRDLTEYFGLDSLDGPVTSAHRAALAGRCGSCRHSWMGKPYWLSVAPVRGEGGQIVGCAGFGHPITEQRRLEEALADLEDRYDELLTATTSYRYTVKLDNGVPLQTEHGAGCVAVTGYKPEEYTADSDLWISMVAPRDVAMVRRHIDRLLAGEELPPLEHRIIRKDGQVRWVRDTIVRHCDNQGRLVRYDGLVEDITWRKHAEAELRDRDLQLAAAQKIQQRFLPSQSPRFPGLETGAAFVPAQFVAGDYYDYFTMPGGYAGFAVGDVSGHGFAPALVMVCTHMLFRILAHTTTDVARILSLANTALIREIEDDRFVTVLLVRIDPSSGWLVYASAGHPAGYVLDRDGQVKASLDSTGLPLSVVPEADYGVGSPVTLEPGDTVLLVTDGVTEAHGPMGDMFGVQRMLAVARANRHQKAARIAQALCDEAARFAAPEAREDDLTAVVVKVTGQGHPAVGR